jgi:hypothetical protein
MHVLPKELEEPDYAALGKTRLRRMARAGEAMIEAERRLAKAGHTLVERMLHAQIEFEPWTHYPAEDVYDYETASQYYYHAHTDRPLEHGHFHLFLRAPAFAPGAEPRRHVNEADEGGTIAHLVAISMNRMGHPLELFVTNGWVTAEDCYGAEELIGALPRWGVDHTQPCLAVNQWLSAAVRFFAPQIEALIRARDEALAPLAAKSGWEEVLEMRDIEVVARIPVAPEAQMREILGLLGGSPRF